MMEIGGSTQEMMEMYGNVGISLWKMMDKIVGMMEIGDQLRLQCACALQWGQHEILSQHVRISVRNIGICTRDNSLFTSKTMDFW